MESILNLKRIFIIAFFLVTMGNPYSLLGTCPQNNFTVTGFQLRDQDGNPFTVIDNYQLGQQVNGELWVMLGGSSTNGYNMRFFFDIYINGVLTQNDQYECIFSGIQAVQGKWVRVRDFSWKWGDIVDVKDIFIHWDTGTAQTGTSCTISDKNNINSQCYGNLNGYTAAVPLFPKFDFAGNGICKTTIQFTSKTIGGTPPYNYTFQWDFDGLGTATGPNPVFNFPSSGTFTIGLTANDGTSVTTIYKDIFIDPNLTIQVDIFPTKVDNNSGIIYVKSVIGGTPPYTYSWTGPNGFTSTSKDIFNLTNGLYILTVTDSNGCSQTVSYELDIASVLNMEWKSFDLALEGDQIRISWELNSEIFGVEYEVQRSYFGNSNFEPIATLPGKINSQSPVRYEFRDHGFSKFEKMIYYRVKKVYGNIHAYSEVKMINRMAVASRDPWLAYPNPSPDGIFNLNFQPTTPTFERTITLHLFDTSNFSQKKTLPIKPGQTIKLSDLFGTLPRGIVFLRIEGEDEVKVFKLINKK